MSEIYVACRRSVSETGYGQEIHLETASCQYESVAGVERPTNAQSCLEEVAKFVTQPNNSMMIKIEVITDAPAWDCVTL